MSRIIFEKHLVFYPLVARKERMHFIHKNTPSRKKYNWTEEK